MLLFSKYLKIDTTKFKTSKKREGKKWIEYYEIPVAFDIETTSTYNECGEKVAFLYHWQLAINEHCYYGRTCEEFVDFINTLHKNFKTTHDKRLLIYVHNLPYEFQFIRKYFEWESVFAVDTRKPIKALTDKGIEFRCSYILSALSLEKVADNLQHSSLKKLKNSLNYNKIRHSNTPLNSQERKYCENDVLILVQYIKEEIEYYGSITRIPLTNTGRVRRLIRNYVVKNRDDYYKIQSMTLSSQEYLLLKRAFTGGYVHANADYVGKIVGQVSSQDLDSAYIAALMYEKFPMNKGRRITLKELKKYYGGFEKACENYCLVFDFKMENVLLKEGLTDCYLSESRYICTNVIENNGRIFKADTVEGSITNVDYCIIKRFYDFEKFGVRNIYIYEKDYLPKSFKNAIINLYEKKTTLKGVRGKEQEYMRSKFMLNSTYGMCVTDIIRDKQVYINNAWDMEKVDLDNEITKYNNSKNRYLSYVWGIFTTAYVRKTIATAIVNLKSDYVYSDTDSVKYKNYERNKGFFEAYNKINYSKMLSMCQIQNFDKQFFIHGEKVLGMFDYEGTYKEFITQGAKRYAYKDSNNEYHITVAGLPKTKGVDYLKRNGGLSAFNDGMSLSEEESGKQTATYLDFECEGKIVDFCGNIGNYKALSSLHLSETTFNMSLSNRFRDFLKQIIEGRMRPIGRIGFWVSRETLGGYYEWIL